MTYEMVTLLSPLRVHSQRLFVCDAPRTGSGVVSQMKRSACPSSVAGKKPFLAPARAACQPRVASGDASRPPARRAAGAAMALVKVHASEHPGDGNSEPTPLCGPPRTPLATIVPGEKASVSTRKPFKPPVSKDSEMSEMYGSSDKVRLCSIPLTEMYQPLLTTRVALRSASEAARRRRACRGSRRTSRTLSCSTRRRRRPTPRTSSPSAELDPCPVPLPCAPASSPRLGPAPCLCPLPRASAPCPPHCVPARVPAPRSSSTDVVPRAAAQRARGARGARPTPRPQAEAAPA